MEFSYQKETPLADSVGSDDGYRKKSNYMGDEEDSTHRTASEDRWYNNEEVVTENDANKYVDETTCTWQYIYDEVW